ncbi:unnamed protein product, partial [Didymodactylos carnosus]
WYNGKIQSLIDRYLGPVVRLSFFNDIDHPRNRRIRNNTIDAHVECAPQRIINVDKDLTAIILKLKDEKLFTIENQHCRKLADEENHDHRCDGILIQAADTGIILLSMAFSKLIKLMQISNFVIKSFNSCTKTHTFIDITKIDEQLLDRIQIQPSVLLVLHGLSDCDSTSFIKNITKINFIGTYFNNPQLYKQLIDFGESTTKIHGYYIFQAKNKESIALDLPPTTDAFYLHCKGARNQVYIWKNPLEPYLVEMPEEQYGYEKVNDQISVIWRSKPPMPADVSLKMNDLDDILPHFQQTTNYWQQSPGQTSLFSLDHDYNAQSLLSSLENSISDGNESSPLSFLALTSIIIPYRASPADSICTLTKLFHVDVIPAKRRNTKNLPFGFMQYSKESSSDGL